MTIRYSTVRNFAIVLLLAAVCGLVYVHFFRPQEPKLVTAPPPEFARLSALIDAHIDTIFSPLDGQVAPIPHQELRMLRGYFADGRTKASAHAQPMFQTAIQLCDTLLPAIQERERSSASLADTRSKPFTVSRYRSTSGKPRKRSVHSSSQMLSGDGRTTANPIVRGSSVCIRDYAHKNASSYLVLKTPWRWQTAR